MSPESILSAIFALAILAVAIPMFIGFFGGAPFLPTPAKALRRLVELAEIRPTDRVLDPGCGDGRLLRACLDAGAATATGYELFFPIYLLARWNARKYRGRMHIRFGDSRTRSLAEVDVVALFLMPGPMERWAGKFLRELAPGARIVSYAFAIPGWIPVRETARIPAENIAPIRVYEIGRSEPRT